MCFASLEIFLTVSYNTHTNKEKKRKEKENEEKRQIKKGKGNSVSNCLEVHIDMAICLYGGGC
jgi:hypothetical protein